MGLRTCPSCANRVAEESQTCPICGRSYRYAMFMKVAPWATLGLVVALVLLSWLLR